MSMKEAFEYLKELINIEMDTVTSPLSEDTVAGVWGNW